MMYYYNKYPVVRELWAKEIKDDGYKSYYLKVGKNFLKKTKHNTKKTSNHK